MGLKERLTEDMKTAMRAKDKERLGVIRLALSAIKQQEVDTRTELDEPTILSLLDKMVKQRRDSITQFRAAERHDLADQEQYELELIQTYLPQQLSAEELDVLVSEAIAATGAVTMKDMGKVMGWIKPKAQGRADMAAINAQIKSRLPV